VPAAVGRGLAERDGARGTRPHAFFALTFTRGRVTHTPPAAHLCLVSGVLAGGARQERAHVAHETLLTDTRALFAHAVPTAPLRADLLGAVVVR
jgi:hypothetical protein